MGYIGLMRTYLWRSSMRGTPIANDIRLSEVCVKHTKERSLPWLHAGFFWLSHGWFTNISLIWRKSIYRKSAPQYSMYSSNKLWSIRIKIVFCISSLPLYMSLLLFFAIFYICLVPIFDILCLCCSYCPHSGCLVLLFICSLFLFYFPDLVYLVIFPYYSSRFLSSSSSSRYSASPPFFLPRRFFPLLFLFLILFYSLSQFSYSPDKYKFHHKPHIIQVFVSLHCSTVTLTCAASLWYLFFF